MTDRYSEWADNPTVAERIDALEEKLDKAERRIGARQSDLREQLDRIELQLAELKGRNSAVVELQGTALGKLDIITERMGAAGPLVAGLTTQLDQIEQAVTPRPWEGDDADA